MQESGDNLAVQDLYVIACITYSVLKKPKLLKDLLPAIGMEGFSAVEVNAFGQLP